MGVAEALPVAIGAGFRIELGGRGFLRRIGRDALRQRDIQRQRRSKSRNDELLEA